MILKSIIACLEEWAPLSLQESYDNSGLIVGNPLEEVNKALLCLDATEEVLDEAIEKKCDLIIAHHPIVFTGIKKLNGKNYIERTLLKAIKNNIAIYAIHTNLDNIIGGVNHKIAERLALQQLKILQPKIEGMKKIQFFVPQTHQNAVSNALFEQGAGHIGAYSQCSFYTSGTGTFKGDESAQPFIGKNNTLENVAEVKVEMVFPHHLQTNMIKALLETHPYQTPAFDIIPLENSSEKIGAGIIGQTTSPIATDYFLEIIKQKLKAPMIRHTKILSPTIQTVALCGGSGSFLLQNAIQAKADIFISSDFKYHQFFDANHQIMIADIGHYESEQFTSELIEQYLSKKMPNFATLLSKVNTNPINYF